METSTCKQISKRTTEVGIGWPCHNPTGFWPDSGRISGRFLAGLEAVTNPPFFLNYITNLADYPAKNWADSRPDSGEQFPRGLLSNGHNFAIFGEIFEKT